jgi:16S rRNA processing protein RimM
VLEAGRVARPHGLDGSFHVSAPVPRLLTLGTSVRVGERVAEIVRRVGTDSKPVIRLAGHETREAAEAVRGEALLVDAGDAPQLQEGEYWAHELAGCTVSDGEREVGVVRRMVELPSVEVLEVQRPGAEDLLVPMVSDAVRSIDVAARRVDVDLGFLGAD